MYNLVAQNTREGAVVQRVPSKLDIMREQMGDDRVYDVIDEWLEGVPLVALMEKAIDAEAPEEAAAETDEALARATRERAEDLLALQQSASLASRLDLRAARELRDASDERRLQPLFIQRFFERAWTAAGGMMRRDDHFPVWHLSPTPTALLEVTRGRKASIPDHMDTPVVFDKQLVSVASTSGGSSRSRAAPARAPSSSPARNWTSCASSVLARGSTRHVLQGRAAAAPDHPGSRAQTERRDALPAGAVCCAGAGLEAAGRGAAGSRRGRSRRMNARTPRLADGHYRSGLSRKDCSPSARPRPPQWERAVSLDVQEAPAC